MDGIANTIEARDEQLYCAALGHNLLLIFLGNNGIKN
jgi:hypothetical protein